MRLARGVGGQKLRRLRGWESRPSLCRDSRPRLSSRAQLGSLTHSRRACPERLERSEGVERVQPSAARQPDAFPERRVARPLSRIPTSPWVPRSCVLCKGGNHERWQRVGGADARRKCDANHWAWPFHGIGSIVPAPSASSGQALAKNTRAGHPQFRNGGKKKETRKLWATRPLRPGFLGEWLTRGIIVQPLYDVLPCHFEMTKIYGSITRTTKTNSQIP
jgi:hypothetical protein